MSKDHEVVDRARDESVASALMVQINRRLAETSISTKDQQERYISVLGALISEIEISMNSAKEGTYDD